MPATSHIERDMARRPTEELGVIDLSKRELHLASGVDRTGRTDIVRDEAA